MLATHPQRFKGGMAARLRRTRTAAATYRYVVLNVGSAVGRIAENGGGLFFFRNCTAASVVSVSPAPVQIANQIRNAMNERGLPVRHVAAAVGVSDQSVRNWCSGKSAPKRRRVAAVERVLGVKIDMSGGHPIDVEVPTREQQFLRKYPEVAGSRTSSRAPKTRCCTF
jgi:transcriptional regulator with XRE-family HTH domain